MTRKRKVTLLACAVIAATAVGVGYTLAQAPASPDPGPAPAYQAPPPHTSRRLPPLAQAGPPSPPGIPGPRGSMRPGMGPQMRPPRRTPSPVADFAGMVRHLRNLCFDSGSVGVLAIGALRDEIRRKPDDVIQDLEGQLETVKTLGLRNAIRLTLKDLYKRQGEDEKALEQLRALIAENDKALQKGRDDEDEEDDD